MDNYLNQIYITLGLALCIVMAGNNGVASASTKRKPKGPEYDINNLKQLCPLVDICTQSKGDNPEISKTSCCFPCKCDSMCKKMGNCCDRNEAQGNMCHLPFVEQEGVELYGKLEYFMVDQCLNGSTFTDCLSEDVAPWGWLYPVYDPVSDLNYYNYRCAECNGVKDYI